MTVPEPETTVESPWDDPAFVANYEADVEAERRGELDEGLTREEIEARYGKTRSAP
ncbi:MAG: hypothetical protein QOH64_1863 [Acidimicrobiaceae bacterium]